MRLKIAPSLLSADFNDLANQIRLVEKGGADYLHLDVMDGHFVPNISFGPVVVAAAKRVTKLPCDVHLMITNPDSYLDAFAKAGADICTVHIETLDAPESTFSRIRELGMKPGLSLNPDTKIQRVLPYLDSVDQILIMSVFPGFSGQAFISAVLEKVRVIARESAGSRLEIEIDGGINNATAPLAVAAGASILVAATAIFRAKDIPSACRELREAAQREAKGFSR